MDGHLDILCALCAALILVSSLLPPLFRKPRIFVNAATSSTLGLGLLLGLLLGLHVFETFTAFVEAAKHSGLPDALPVSSPIIFALAYAVQLESLYYEGPKTLSDIPVGLWFIDVWLEIIRARTLLATAYHSFQPLLVTTIKVLGLTALLSNISRVTARPGDRKSTPEGDKRDDPTPIAETDTEANRNYGKFDQDAYAEMKELGGWWPWLQRFSVFWKYFWPVGEPWLQSNAIFTILLAFVSKILTILFSYYLGLLVTELAEALKRSELRSAEVRPLFLWLAITYTSTSSAVIPNLRSYLYMKVRVFRTGELHRAFHEKTMSLDFSFHNTVNSADIIRITNDSKGLLDALDNVFIVLVPNMIMLVTSATFLISKHRQFMALDLLVLVVGYFITQRRTAKKLSKELDHYFAFQKDTEACCRENILCWETITSHNKTTAAVKQHGSKVDAWVKQWAEYLIHFYVGEFSAGIVVLLTFTFGLLLILNDIFNERATPGELVAFVGYWQNIITSLNNFKDTNTDILGKLIEATRGRRLLEMSLQVEDGSEYYFGGGGFVFMDVGFSYEGKKDPALNGLNLQITAGTRVSLLGKSGSGKSTMLKLLVGLLRPSRGHIQVDKQNIEGISISSLRSRVGSITQNTRLFDQSVTDNMRLFANQDVTEEQIQEACRKACIHDTILSFPDGYGTRIGNDGQKLSGGERQRLLIARLFLQNPDIVLLDEVTSALDIDTKASVQKAIREAFPNRTVIQIEHDFSSTESADSIVVLGEGCSVLEQGTHESLLQRNGYYANLWKQHTGELESREGEL